MPALLGELARLAAAGSSVPEPKVERAPVRVSAESAAPTLSVRDVARVRVEAFLRSRQDGGGSARLVGLLALLPRPAVASVIERAVEALWDGEGPAATTLIDEARAAGIIRRVGADRIDFQSPALADASRQIVPEDRVATFRRACAEGPRGGEPVAADRARARVLLARAGDPREALGLLLDAGEELLRFDLDAARAALRGAVEAAEAAGLTAQDLQARRARLGLARAERNSGALTEALATLAPLAETELPDAAVGGVPATRASVLLLRGELAEAAAAARSALDVLGEAAEPGSLARATRILGEAAFRSGSVGDAERAFTRSLEHAIRAASDEDQLAARWRLARVRRVRSEVEEAGAAFQEVLAQARELGSPSWPSTRSLGPAGGWRPSTNSYPAPYPTATGSGSRPFGWPCGPVRERWTRLRRPSTSSTSRASRATATCCSCSSAREIWRVATGSSPSRPTSWRRPSTWPAGSTSRPRRSGSVNGWGSWWGPGARDGSGPGVG